MLPIIGLLEVSDFQELMRGEIRSKSHTRTRLDGYSRNPKRSKVAMSLCRSGTVFQRGYAKARDCIGLAAKLALERVLSCAS